MQFKCACGKTLKTPDAMAGKQVRCPGCGNVLTVPSEKTPASAAADNKIIVTCSCGKRMAAPAGAAGKQVRCPGCGAAVPVPGGSADKGLEPRLAGQPQPEQQPDDNAYGVAALYCPNCRAELETGAQFCVSCGTHLASGAKHEEIDADEVRKKRKSESLKRVLGIARIAIPLIIFAGACWAAWVYGMPKYREWKKNRPDDAARKTESGQSRQQPAEQPVAPAPKPADAPTDNSPKTPQEPPSPLRTPRKPGTLGHAPKKTGNEGYLELVVYQPSRTQDKLALISVRKSIQAFKTLQGRMPKDLLEAHAEYQFEPAPPGTEYEYEPLAPKGKQVGIRRLRDKPPPAGDNPELD